MRISRLASLGLVMLAAPALADDATPAKTLFGAKSAPAAMAPVSIGSYARGCLGGGEMLPIDGPTWQVMRLSRNRNWGHPALIDFAERLAGRASKAAGWPGLLIGDLAQPRGGPMTSGHASHQIGLDMDIWLNPAPKRRLTADEREKISAVSMLGSDKRSVDPKIWTRGHLEVIKAAATDPAVARIFVNAAIKKELCESAGNDRAWLRVVRPWWGHHYHFHVRLDCPAGSSGCVAQKPPPAGDGCGAELDAWLKPPPKKPAKPEKPKKPAKPKPQITMNDMPAACRQVLAAPDREAAAPVAYAPAPVTAPAAAAAKAIAPADVPLPQAAPPIEAEALPAADVPLPVPSPARRS